MNTYKAYKLRIYPTDSQRELIEKTFGCTRYIYNNFLAERKNKYEESKTKVHVYEQLKELTDLKREKEWLREIDSCALQACVYNLDDAFQKFFKGNGYPEFRAKGVHESFRTNNTLNTYKDKKYESIRIDFNKRIITLPKLKEVKFRGYRTTKEIVGKIKSATISKDGNKYFVSILVEVPFTKYSINPTSIVGLDLGIKNFIVTSNGEKLKNEEFRQNFDVFRLPIFRNEAKMLEKILLRGNEEGVWNIRDPHMRAHSYIFAMFGLAEAPEVDTENLKQEIREVTKAMLQIEIPEENEEGE